MTVHTVMIVFCTCLALEHCSSLSGQKQTSATHATHTLVMYTSHTYPYLPSGLKTMLCAILRLLFVKPRSCTGALTMLCNAPHSTVIPLMLSEPLMWRCWRVGRDWVAVGTVGKARPISVDSGHAHTHAHTLSCGLCIRREVCPGKCLTWIWDAGWRHSADARP